MTKNLSNQALSFDLDVLFKKYPQIDRNLLSEAFDLCKNKERALFMLRRIVNFRLSTKSILAAILFDVNPVKIRQIFGVEVLDLVTRNKAFINFYIPGNVKNDLEAKVVKMLIIYAKDLRVIFLAIISFIYLLRFEKNYFSKKEVANILRFIPLLCSRLNLWELKIEIEDLCLAILFPDQYQKIQIKLEKLKKERKVYMNYCIEILKNEFEKLGIKIKVSGRIKHIYSIYKKIEIKRIKFEKIYDLIALRIIVNDITECYLALSVVHSLWKPHFEKIKDYIAVPKPNNYQSLHTTVRGPENHYVEIQIRTQKMDYEATYGIAAHWDYAQNKRSKIKAEKEALWSKIFLDRQRKKGKIKFEDLQLIFDQKNLFVFTQKGDVVCLPKNASIIDLAFALNQKSAFNLKTCEINNHSKSLLSKLSNGDFVNLHYAKKHTIKKTWLNCVVTNKAKRKISQYFLKQ